MKPSSNVNGYTRTRAIYLYHVFLGSSDGPDTLVATYRQSKPAIRLVNMLRARNPDAMPYMVYGVANSHTEGKYPRMLLDCPAEFGD